MAAESVRAHQPNLPASTGSREEPGGASSGPSFAALLKALRRRWLLASFLCLMLTGLTLAAVWNWLPPPKPLAQTVLYISATQPGVIGGGGLSGSEFTFYQQSQKALFTSRPVLTAALSDPTVRELAIVRGQSDQVDWLQKEIKIDFKTGPEYMRATLSGDNSDELKTLLAAITAAYLREIVNRERNKSLAHLRQLEDILSDYEEDLKSKRHSIEKLTVAVGSGDSQVIAVKQRYAEEILGQTQKDLIQTRSALRRLRLDLMAQADKEKNLANAEIHAALVEKEIQKDSVISKEREAESEVQKKLDTLSPVLRDGENDPSLKPLVKQREAILQRIEARRIKLWPDITKRLREQALQEAKQGTENLRERESSLKTLEAELTTAVEAMHKQSVKTNVSQLEIEKRKQEIAQAAKICELAMSKAEILKIELLAPARVTPVEEAYITQEDPTKRRMKVAALAVAGVLFAVLGLVGWFEYRRRRIHEVTEVQDELGIQVLGTIPTLPAGRRRSGSERDDAYRRQQGLLAECVDAARTRLIHAADGEGMRVVMVTSALPREGKTTLARHLAISLAQTGRRTLLVDGDLRLPSQHRFFDLALQPGLAEILRGEADVKKAVQPTATEGLWVLPAGNANLRAIQALAQQPLRFLIPLLREQYDCVVIDSGPILPVADGLQIGQQVDGVILSVMRGVSQVSMVRAAHQRVVDLNIRVLGAVVNGVDLKSVYGSWYSDGYAKVYELPPEASSAAADDGSWYSRGYAQVHEQFDPTRAGGSTPTLAEFAGQVAKQRKDAAEGNAQASTGSCQKEPLAGFQEAVAVPEPPCPLRLSRAYFRSVAVVGTNGECWIIDLGLATYPEDAGKPEPAGALASRAPCRPAS